METIKLGSLYINNLAVNSGCICIDSADITIGHTVPGKALEWVPYENLLVATRCVCFKISWEKLNRVGLIFGTPIRIDGRTYMCRSLKLGANPEEFNEWEAILAKLGDDSNVLDWKNRFWGQESSASMSIYRVVRGGPVPTRWWSYPPAAQEVNIGFRPVLEQLSNKSAKPEDLLEKCVVAYGPLGIAIRGKLIDFDNYDIVIESQYYLYDDCYWATRDGDRIIVNQASITWLKEETE